MNKVVLITGATGGIGQATAYKFAKEGYDIIVHGRKLTDLSDTIKHVQSLNRKILPVCADFLNTEEIETMFAEIKKSYAKIDILINNAGMVNRKKLAQISAEDFQNIFMVNVTAPFLCSRLALDIGCESIVNIGSMRALPQQATAPDYSSSKAALHNMTASLASAFAPHCRVNCVAPGFTQTPLHENNLSRLEQEAKLTPLQKYATPEVIAESVYFIAGEQSSFTTGIVLVVDGGRSIVLKNI